MGDRYADIAFTGTGKSFQQKMGWNCPQHITPRFTAAECGFLMEGAQPGRRAISSEENKPPPVRRDASNPAEEASNG